MIELCPDCGTYLDHDGNCPNCITRSVSPEQLDEILPEQECTFPKELIDHLQERERVNARR